MPEYTAPGVYVEETSFQARSIVGVGTTATGFVGPSRFGPVHLAVTPLTGLADFERLYGDSSPLAWGATVRTNFLWHATRAFFSEGGKRLHFARIFRPLAGPDGSASTAAYVPPPPDIGADKARPTDGLYQQDGHARLLLSRGGAALLLRARFPGLAGNLQPRFSLLFQPNTLAAFRGVNSVVGLRPGALVWLGNRLTGTPGRLLLANPVADGSNWYFGATGRPGDIQAWLNPPAAGLPPAPVLSPRLQALRVLSLNLELPSPAGGGLVWNDLTLQPGSRNGLLERFAPGQGSLPPLELLPSPELAEPAVLFNLLFGCEAGSLPVPASGSLEACFALAGGNDGQEPSPEDYRGMQTDPLVSGLCALAGIADLSMVAAPGSSSPTLPGSPVPQAVANYLIQHAEELRYRIALLDSPPGQSLADIRGYRAGFDSAHAALYYPWVQVQDAAGGRPLLLPPSGFVAGLFVRNDLERGAAKAPANCVITLATGLETMLTDQQQGLLNPEGIDCLRFFPGRGFLLWGARLVSSDPEWTYINVRRYFIYLERSLDLGTQWAVFEPNGERLWAELRSLIGSFLYAEWSAGRLLGAKPDQAYFVHCDRNTMTQADIDSGRVVCEVGVAMLRPAEFVIFRLGQWTADHGP